MAFTHVRPNPTMMFRESRIEPKSIVRARIVTTVNCASSSTCDSCRGASASVNPKYVLSR
jgi:hypothetical protein